MKTYTFRKAGLVAAVVITMAGSAYAGWDQQADRDNDLRQTDPESVLGQEIRPALETGSLPADHDMVSEGSAKSEVPTVEIGGFVYRIGIDTGP